MLMLTMLLSLLERNENSYLSLLNIDVFYEYCVLENKLMLGDIASIL